MSKIRRAFENKKALIAFIPCAIGFGISKPVQARDMAKLADGVIVGSAIVRFLEQYGSDAPEYIGSYVKSMTAAMDSL